jgi:hypothetical protein
MLLVSLVVPRNRHHTSPTPPPNQTYQTLTPEELAFLKKKYGAAGKITLQQETLPTTDPISLGSSTLPLNQISTHIEPVFV